MSRRGKAPPWTPKQRKVIKELLSLGLEPKEIASRHWQSPDLSGRGWAAVKCEAHRLKSWMRERLGVACDQS